MRPQRDFLLLVGLARSCPKARRLDRGRLPGTPATVPHKHHSASERSAGIGNICNGGHDGQLTADQGSGAAAIGDRLGESTGFFSRAGATLNQARCLAPRKAQISIIEPQLALLRGLVRRVEPPKDGIAQDGCADARRALSATVAKAMTRRATVSPAADDQDSRPRIVDALIWLGQVEGTTARIGCTVACTNTFGHLYSVLSLPIER